MQTRYINMLGYIWIFYEEAVRESELAKEGNIIAMEFLQRWEL